MTNKLVYEKSILKQTFEDCLHLVETDKFLLSFAEEKYKHSLQVFGAGNYILKHEPFFTDKEETFISRAKAACLLHDIGRFREIELLYADMNTKHDHSRYGYEMLKNQKFDDLRLLLPIKTHGHLKDALDNDEEFKEIKSAELQTEVRAIYQLVKDADKIANLYLIKTDDRIFKDLFAKKKFYDGMALSFSPQVWQSFEDCCLVPSVCVKTFLDRLLQVICLVFEIYYQPSFHFLQQHGLVEHLLMILRRYNPDEKLQNYVEEKVRAYLAAQSE